MKGPGYPENRDDGALTERRRYPPPELELGVLAASKIAAIIFVPLSIIATLFGVYLQGFRSDLRLDMQKVVSEALDKHEGTERRTFATLPSVQAVHDQLEQLRRDHDDLEKQVAINTQLLMRLAQKNGVNR